MLLLPLIALEACARADQSVEFFRSENYTFSAGERQGIEEIANSTFREVRLLLPGLPARIQLTVRPGSDVIEETGETGAAMPPDAIMWTVDPQRNGGVDAVAQKWLRASLFHELHHLARAARQPPKSLIDHAIHEGMATVFERDLAGAEVPWGAYPENIDQWSDELTRLADDSSVKDWLYNHPDGRRWIGIKVGTYWVDRAIAKSGRSVGEFTTLSSAEMLELAGVERSR